MLVLCILLIAFSELNALHLSPKSTSVLVGRFNPAIFATADAKTSFSLKPYLTKLVQRSDLTTEETEIVWDYILSGSDPVSTGALLALLRAKGETPKEVAGMVNSMKRACSAVHYAGDLLDIVGTGGDGADTINISTASIILAAACGCKVAKAGNRSVSSKCGSADVLEMLGVAIELSPRQVEKAIAECGIGFMYAPINHPAMKNVAPIRKSLGIRTSFNLLGPITNAAGSNRVVIGVFDSNLVELIGHTLMEIGSIDHGVVIHGCGLDEISPLGESTVFEIVNKAKKGEKKQYEHKIFNFDPASVGVPRCKIEDLRGGDAEYNAQALRDVLKGGDFTDAKRDSIVLNAGMGAYVYGLESSIDKAVVLARKVLYSGKALEKLDEWIRVSQNAAKLQL